MIGRLSGTLIEKQAPRLLVDINGVGYDVLAPMTTFYRLPELGNQVVLHTHFSVSETAQQLYGFVNTHDRELFRLLIKVNGVGPKMAIGIMSMESDDFVRCVMSNNIDALVKVPGVGKKTAERLVVEMRDALQGWGIPAAHETAEPINAQQRSGNTLVGDAESALIALGYKPTEAARAITRVMSDDIERSEELIRLALKNMLPA